MDVKSPERRRVLLVFRLHFQNHLILICRRINGGDLPRAESIAKGRLNLLNCQPERRCEFAIDIDINLRGINLQITIDILNRRQVPHLLLKDSCVLVENRGTCALKRDLIETTSCLAANIDRRWILNKDSETRFVGELGT